MKNFSSNILSRFSDCMVSVDLFGFPVSLFVNQNDQFRSKFGGLCSILVVGILMFVVQGKTIAYLRNSDVSSSTTKTFHPNPTQLILNESNYMFAVAVQQIESHTDPQESRFTIEVTQITNIQDRYGKKHKSSKVINMETCTLEKFQKIFTRYGQNFSSQFERIQLDTYLCPQYINNFIIRNNYSISLEGTYSNEIFSYLQILVKPCIRNSQLGISCPDPTNIQGTKQVFNIYQTNYVVNSEASTNYIKPYLSDQLSFKFSPMKLAKAANIFLTEYTISNDRNIFYGAEPTTEQIILSEYNDFNEEIDIDASNVFGSFYLRRSFFSTDIQRSSFKFLDLVSYLGGLSGVLVPFIGYFLSIYNKHQYLLYLANKIYDFDHSVGNYDSLMQSSINQSQLPKNLTQRKNLSSTTTKNTFLQLIQPIDDTETTPGYAQKMISAKEMIKSQENNSGRKLKPISTGFKWLINKMTFLEIFKDSKVQAVDKAIYQQTLEGHFQSRIADPIQSQIEINITVGEDIGQTTAVFEINKREVVGPPIFKFGRVQRTQSLKRPTRVVNKEWEHQPHFRCILNVINASELNKNLLNIIHEDMQKQVSGVPKVEKQVQSEKGSDLSQILEEV